MAEEKKAEVIVETPAATSEEMLVKLDKASAKLEAENKRMEQNMLLANAEKLEKSLGGEAGGTVKDPKVEETPEEYADKIMAGDK